MLMPAWLSLFNLKEPSIQSFAGSRRKSFLYNTKSEVSVSNEMLTDKSGLHKDHITMLRKYNRSIVTAQLVLV